MKHGQALVMVWGEQPPIFSIGYDPPKDDPYGRDSGFTILYDDSPNPEDVTGDDDPRITWVCMHCVIDEHPEIGPGLAIARHYRVADLDDNNQWVPGDQSRLEPNGN